MKRINFTKITIKNFLSIGNEPVVINFKQGMNVIMGVNRDEEDIKNGAGKCLDKRTKINVRVPEEIYKILSKTISKD